MLGAVIASPYEFHSVKRKDFELFCEYLRMFRFKNIRSVIWN